MPNDVVEARPSSTVALVRSGASGPEVFMVKRHAQSAFGSTFAFPGGVLEAADARVHDMSTGLSAERADQLLHLHGDALDYYSAAIRELFEEAGVLLAEHRLSLAQLQAARAALNAGSLCWEQFARDSALLLHYDRLHYFSFWITPAGLPKRYSARFFLAELPPAQVACHDGGELTESFWMTAADVLDARRQKRMQLPYVTRKTLQRMAGFATTAELLAWARACGEKGVRCDEPAYKPELLQ